MTQTVTGATQWPRSLRPLALADSESDRCLLGNLAILPFVVSDSEKLKP